MRAEHLEGELSYIADDSGCEPRRRRRTGAPPGDKRACIHRNIR